MRRSREKINPNRQSESTIKQSKKEKRKKEVVEVEEADDGDEEKQAPVDVKGVISYSYLDEPQRSQGIPFVGPEEVLDSTSPPSDPSLPVKLVDKKTQKTTTVESTESDSNLENEDEDEESPYSGTESFNTFSCAAQLNCYSFKHNDYSSAGVLVEVLPNELIVSILSYLLPTDLCCFKTLSSFWSDFVRIDCLWQVSLPPYLRDLAQKSTTKWRNKGLRAHWQSKSITPPDYAFSALLCYYFPGDNVARQFWREKFPCNILEGVSWNCFAKNFYEFLQIKSEPVFTVEQLEEEKDPRILDNPTALYDYRCLKILMCRTESKDEKEDGPLTDTQPTEPTATEKPATSEPEPEALITIESFSALLKWFGHMSRPYRYNRQNLLTRIRKTFKYCAFHGFISSNALKKKLAGYPSGTFAIRFSETTPGFFVLARVHSDGKVTEGRMYWDTKKGFTVGNYSAKTLTKFCRELRKKLHLKYICGKRTCYEKLFELPKNESLTSFELALEDDIEQEIDDEEDRTSMNN
eukprot:TRINITY_DN2619_c0_g1_i1.p1 TRINITY_DN2619_c0_g1~~TRINITY_DN2619_c0_g1_i1.p1  ORF type:complete len:522 (-),score=67.79 TRINITY_DN2619_c0_g1_i1:260-1825(-)